MTYQYPRETGFAPCTMQSIPVFTGRVGNPRVFLQVENYDVIINNGSSRRPVSTGVQKCHPCSRGRVGKEHSHTMLSPTWSVHTGARYTLPCSRPYSRVVKRCLCTSVNTDPVDGPCSRVVYGPAPVNTAREHGCSQ